MNWLQDRGLISDNCLEFWEVAPVDVEEVMEQAAFTYNPDWIAWILATWKKKENLC